MYDSREKSLSEDMIHPNGEGIKLLGNGVAQTIKIVLCQKINILKILLSK